MKYLLTGGTGVLGTELQKHLDCVAPSRADLDIGSSLSIVHYCRDQCFKGIIHAAAYTDVPKSETNTKEAILSNIIGTKTVSDIFDDTRIIYISTDYVYAGLVGRYKENDKTDPFNFYGFTKLGGEAFMNQDKDLIVRTSFKPNGRWPFPRAFTDLHTSADYVDIIAKEIALVIDSNLTGVINVGTERKTIWELASRRTPEVGEMSIKEVIDVRMPRDISMNIDNFLNFKKQSGGSK